jgi:hypothetical protein
MPERWIGRGKKIAVKPNRVPVMQVHPERRDFPQNRIIPTSLINPATPGRETRKRISTRDRIPVMIGTIAPPIVGSDGASLNPVHSSHGS